MLVEFEKKEKKQISKNNVESLPTLESNISDKVCDSILNNSVETINSVESSPILGQNQIKPQTQLKNQGNQSQIQKSGQNHGFKSKYGDLFTRIKKIKNFEIYLAVGLILVMIAIYMTTFGSNTSTNGTTTTNNEENYAREIESRLVKTLSQISGAGRVDAMVTVEGSATIEVAYNIDEKTITQSGGNESSTSTTTIVKTPVIVNGRDGPQPLILFEIKPKIKGIIIVASGAYDVGVRLQLMRAVQTVVADDNVRIEIFTGR